jgi:hypothetical protein
MFTVVERSAISDELAAASQRWLAQHRLGEELDEGWLELVCEDGDVFRPDNIMLHLAVPPCAVSPGDSVDVGRAQTVGRLWPDQWSQPGEVPKDLALARTFVQRDGVWVGTCELPGPVKELFRVEDPAALLAVMNATRRTLNRGALRISGDPDGELTLTVVEDNVAAWGSTKARVREAFTCWLDAGPAGALATPLRDATYAVGSLGALDDLIIANQDAAEARCPLDEAGPAPDPLPPDYFESQAQGRVEGLHIDRSGGLGRDALAMIASVRPGEVSFAVGDDGILLISDPAGEGDAFELPGPGFAPREEGGNIRTTIVVPYVVALAIYDGAAAGAVDVAVDDRWGRVHRADHGVTVQWRR